MRLLPGGEVLTIVEERSAIAVLKNATSETWQAVDSDGTRFAAVDPADYPTLLRLRSDAAGVSADDIATALEVAARVEASGVARPDAIVLPARSDSAQDVEAFNNNRDLDMRLHTIFANGQVTLSAVGEGAGLQMLLNQRQQATKTHRLVPSQIAAQKRSIIMTLATSVD